MSTFTFLINHGTSLILCTLVYTCVMFRPCTFLLYTCTISIAVKPVSPICVHLYSNLQWIIFEISLPGEYFRYNKNENDRKYCNFRECKDNFQIRHKMIKGILLVDMIDPWNKFELCLKPVSKYISEQLTRPFAVLVDGAMNLILRRCNDVSIRMLRLIEKNLFTFSVLSVCWLLGRSDPNQ